MNVQNSGFSVIDQMSQAINQRKFDQAISLGESQEVTDEDRNNAHYYFQLALAYSMSGDKTHPYRLREQASKCLNYTQVLDLDFDRDEVLAQIRSKNFGEAEMLSDVSKIRLSKLRLDLPTPEIMARIRVWHMVDGRLLFAKGQYSEARICLRKGARWLDEIDLPEAIQWRRNNRFYWMLAEAVLGYTKITKELASQVVHDEPSSSKRRLAKIIGVVSFFGATPLESVAKFIIKRIEKR